MKSILYTVAFLLLSQIGFTQTTTSYTSFTFPVTTKSRSMGGGSVTHNTGGVVTSITGSPYLNEYFLKGRIELSDGEVLEGVQIRYNVHEDIMEIDNDGEILGINKPDKIRKVMFNDRTYIYNPYLTGKDVEKNGYFEVLIEGPMTLYCKRTNKLEMKALNSNFGKSGMGASYFDMQKYFFVQTQNEEVFPLTKKKLLEYAGSSKSEIKKYIKKRKIRFSEERDLIGLIKFYNKSI